MNNAVMIAAATGAAYKLSGVAGMAAGRVAEYALERSVSYLFRSSTDKAEADTYHDENQNLSKYEHMTENEFIQDLKKVSVQHILTEMDIEARLKAAKALMKSIPRQSKILAVSIQNLEEACDKLHFILYEVIYAKIDAYNKSRSRFLYSLNLKKELCDLRLYSILLERRQQNLISSIETEAIIEKSHLQRCTPTVEVL